MDSEFSAVDEPGQLTEYLQSTTVRVEVRDGESLMVIGTGCVGLRVSQLDGGGGGQEVT